MESTSCCKRLDIAGADDWWPPLESTVGSSVTLAFPLLDTCKFPAPCTEWMTPPLWVSVALELTELVDCCPRLYLSAWSLVSSCRSNSLNLLTLCSCFSSSMTGWRGKIRRLCMSVLSERSCGSSSSSRGDDASGCGCSWPRKLLNEGETTNKISQFYTTYFYSGLSFAILAPSTQPRLKLDAVLLTQKATHTHTQQTLLQLAG